ncbi:MAG TPA: hypothetical protein VFY75_10115 [Solirubrobacterales bacterium]|nr:hypothetical protein [Solirubrobacterales bacterium]
MARLLTSKPQEASGYSSEESELVKATCLTVAAILGDLMEDICIVGGLVPSMICPVEIDPAAAEDAHCGTRDLDVGLSLGLLDDERYKEMAERLRNRGFEPDENDEGRATRQRWRWQKKITIDFLIPPASGQSPGKLQSLESDLAAQIVEPLHLAFEELVPIDVEGKNLFGDQLTRTVNFSGPASFVAMKAFAYRLRGEPKDTYDLVFVLTHWEPGLEDICHRLEARAAEWSEIVSTALEYLRGDFETVDSNGPRDYSRFIDSTIDDRRLADAHGAVTDFLAAWEQLRSRPGAPQRDQAMGR